MPENNQFDIKKRITAARQTRKITRTMQLIASSRLQRGKTQLAHCQEWKKHMGEAVRCLSDSCFEPLEQARADSKIGYIVFGGSKGLSGSYSPTLLQYAKPKVKGHIIIAAGSAAEAFFSDAHSYLGDEAPSADYAKSITDIALRIYESKEVRAVYMIYTQGSQHVTEQLLPLPRPEDEQSISMITEPSARVLRPVLYKEYAQLLVHEAHLRAFVAEQIARVTAMDSATRNADKIIENLQTTYNRIRQSSITQEIITVSNAAKGDG